MLKFYLSPFTGRGRERSERVRGCAWRILKAPLTPTLSPQVQGEGEEMRLVAALTLQDFKRPVQNLPQLLPKTSSADLPLNPHGSNAGGSHEFEVCVYRDPASPARSRLCIRIPSRLTPRSTAQGCRLPSVLRRLVCGRPVRIFANLR